MRRLGWLPWCALVASSTIFGCSPATEGPSPSSGGSLGPSGGASPTGGATASGGSSTGGAHASGGATTGGASTGGNSASGGSPSGGAPSGGAASGGASQVGGAASGGDSVGGSGGGTSTGGSESTSNCESTLAAGDTNRSVQIDGATRKFITHIPKGYTGTTPVPLVLDFHPLGGTGSQEKGSSGFAALSDKDGFIILWPDGIDNAWNVGPCCTNSRDVDDVAFARAMVQDLQKIACVDEKHVYSTGFSMGGGMSHYLACHAADVFAAVAPSGFDLLEENVDGCKPSRPISVFSMRGSNDTVAPFNGGPGSSGKATFLGAQATLEKWAELDGCQGEPTVTGSTQMYTECDAGVEVGLLVNQGGGHAPGPADVAWSFLKSKALP